VIHGRSNMHEPETAGKYLLRVRLRIGTALRAGRNCRSWKLRPPKNHGAASSFRTTKTSTALQHTYMHVYYLRIRPNTTRIHGFRNRSH
jgi:hypothetical protein